MSDIARPVSLYSGDEVLTLPRVETGIPGFDHVSAGGLTQGRATLVVGAAGSAKTIFAGQFVVEGAKAGEPGVFVTLEEPAQELRRNFATLGWDVDKLERDELLEFVDGSPLLGEGYGDEAGGAPEGDEFDILAAQIGHAADRVGATRIAIDSLNAVVSRFSSEYDLRRRMRLLITRLKRLGLTIVMTSEARDGEETDGLDVGEYVVDNVVVLRNTLESEKRRRTVEVLKMRGALHRKGEYPFTVLPGQGIVVIPLSVVSLTARSSDARVTSGNPELDALCGGGFFRDSIVLASGATGTGKTLMVTEFMAGGADSGERSLLLAFEESRDQIFRNARGWGRDFAQMERDGRLRLVATYPEVASLEDHLVEIKNLIDEYQPSRVAIDSLSALERIGSPKAFREFIIGLTSFLKAGETTALLTAATTTLLGGSSITEGHISTLTDSIILLRYVEMRGEIKRGLTVLKMRGSAHDREIHEFTINGSGLHVGPVFRGMSGILAGNVLETAEQSAD
ncbi:MAG: circadian clock protein KaiC [Actinomycetales bacterium]